MKSKISLLMLLPIMSMGFTIGDKVWLDTNQNWEQDHGEKGMAGVKIKLLTAEGKRVKTTTTDKNGKYHFNGVAEGDYVVKVVVPKEMTAVTDSKLELWLDKNREDIDFGLYSKNHKGDYSIGGKVWHDTNENWEEDHGEKGMADVTVNLFNASGEKVSTIKTDYNGNYKFEELPEDDYVIKVEASKGMTAVTDSKIEVWLDKNRKNINFGLFSKKHTGDYSIGGRAWNDTNENWEKDSNEKEMAGVTINLLKASGEKVSTIITDYNGNYIFEELPKGDYVIKVEIPKEMRAVTDTMLEVWLDKSRTDKNFGFYGKYGDVVIPPVIVPPVNGEPITLKQLKAMINYGQDVTKVNTSEITDMSNLFYDTSFNQDISKWDVSNVKNMHQMFMGTYRRPSIFNQDISSWDVSKVEDMSGMFSSENLWKASLFNQDISNWNVSNVKNMSKMFFRSDKFNQPIGNWDVSNVTDMSDMFNMDTSSSAQSGFNQDISNWNVSKVKNMSRMFMENEFFNKNINNWDVSSVKNMREMFRGTRQFNQPLNKWDVSSVEDMSFMFAYSLFNHPLEDWDVSSVKNMHKMFYWWASIRSNFNQPIGKWDVSNVTDMSEMFAYNRYFNQDLRQWNVTNVTNHFKIFDTCPIKEGYKPKFK